MKMKILFINGVITFSTHLDAVNFYGNCSENSNSLCKDWAVPAGNVVAVCGTFRGSENDFEDFILEIGNAVMGEICVENKFNDKVCKYTLLNGWQKQNGYKKVLYEGTRKKI